MKSKNPSDVFNILLQVLDDDPSNRIQKGRKVDFRNTILIMTSNLGDVALRDEKTLDSVQKPYESMTIRQWKNASRRVEECVPS